MTRELLSEYYNAKKELEEINRRIEKLELEIAKLSADTVVDSVSGGYGGTQHFRIEGYATSDISKKRMQLLERRITYETIRQQLDEMTVDVEKFIFGIEESRTRRIFTMRYIDGKNWQEIATDMGGGNTADGVRMIANRYMLKK